MLQTSRTRKRVGKKIFFFFFFFFLHRTRRSVGEGDQTSFFLGQCDFEIYVVPGIRRERSISVELFRRCVTELEKLKQRPVDFAEELLEQPVVPSVL